MQSKDKIEQLKASIQAKKEAEARVAAQAAAGETLSTGMEEQYKKKISELEEAVKNLQSQFEASEAQAKEEKEKYLRLYAEFENVRKRLAREKEEQARYSHEKMVKELLPVLDGLEKALHHGHESQDIPTLLEGVELVLKQFHKALEGFGVAPVEAKGKPFDPNFHEAMAHHESEEHEPDTVVEEYRRGYTFHDRLLRPALVTVAKPPEKK